MRAVQKIRNDAVAACDAAAKCSVQYIAKNYSSAVTATELAEAGVAACSYHIDEYQAAMRSWLYFSMQTEFIAENLKQNIAARDSKKAASECKAEAYGLALQAAVAARK